MRWSFSLVAIMIAAAGCRSKEPAPAAPKPAAVADAPSKRPPPPPEPSPVPTQVDENDPLSVRPASGPGDFVSRYADYMVREKSLGNGFQAARAEALIKKTRYAVDMLKGVVDSRANFPCNQEDDYIRGCALKSLHGLDAQAALDRAKKIYGKADRLCELERSAATLLATHLPDEAMMDFSLRLQSDPNLQKSDGLLESIHLATGTDRARLTKAQQMLQKALAEVKAPEAKKALQAQATQVKAALASSK